MARYSTDQFNNEQQDDGFLTLVQLLDRAQPYKEFSHLHDPELDIDHDILQRIQGSLVGLAVGDALGAPVEFRPNDYLKQNPLKDMRSGGTWGLEAGQWTDDTSMALCLAASLIIKGKSDAYDQLVRFKRWHRDGYMSATGKCFDIGKSTREAIMEFENRQLDVVNIMKEKKLDNKGSPPSDEVIGQYFHQYGFKVECGSPESAGNGCLMRLTPIPSFFFRSYENVKKYLDESTKLTHADQKAIEATQFYAGLIWHALNGMPKEKLLEADFYRTYLNISLQQDVLTIAQGSYKTKNGYDDGIRGKGYVLATLEAALWAFYHDNNSFEKGVLDAVNLGDDTDTTAAIYGQLAGAVYGIEQIPDRWRTQLFEGKFIMTVATGLYVKGKEFGNEQQKPDGADQKRSQTNRNAIKHDEQKTTVPKPVPSDQHTNKTGPQHSSQVPNRNNESLQTPKPSTASTFRHPQPGIEKKAPSPGHSVRNKPAASSQTAANPSGPGVHDQSTGDKRTFIHSESGTKNLSPNKSDPGERESTHRTVHGHQPGSRNEMSHDPRHKNIDPSERESTRSTVHGQESGSRNDMSHDSRHKNMDPRSSQDKLGHKQSTSQQDQHKNTDPTSSSAKKPNTINE